VGSNVPRDNDGACGVDVLRLVFYPFHIRLQALLRRLRRFALEFDADCFSRGIVRLIERRGRGLGLRQNNQNHSSTLATYGMVRCGMPRSLTSRLGNKVH